MRYAFVLWTKERFPEMYDYIDKIKSGESVEETWLFQDNAISEGDRVFVYSSEKTAHGFIAAGHALTGKYTEKNEEGKNEGIIKIKFDSITEFNNGECLSLDTINEIAPHLAQRSGSGHMIPDDKRYDIELAWAEVIGVNNDLYNLLKVSPEINPDQHDGSYELVREAVASYSRLEDFSLLTFADIDLIYRFSVITKNKETYYNAIDKTTLSDTEKNRLKGIVDSVWSKAESSFYSNHEDETTSVGMFEDSLHTFNEPQKDYDADIPFKLMSAFKYIANHNAQENYTYIKNNLSSNINGVSYDSFSTIAHCLKPNDFLISNSKQGFGNVFKDLGISIIDTGILSDYAKNCENITEYVRNNNFLFKNFRVFDLISKMINKKNINFDIIRQLLIGHKGESYSKKNETQKDKDLKILGIKAKKEFDKFSKYINEDFNLFKGSSSGWINQGQNVPNYIWVEFKDEDKVKYKDVFITKNTKKGPKQELKEIPFSVALSVNRNDSNDLYYSLRVEYRESGTDDKEKNTFNKNILFDLEDDNHIYYEIYSKNNYRKVNNRADALTIYNNEKDSIEKIRSVYLLSAPYSSSRTDELISEAKEGLELLLKPYRSIFDGAISSANTSLSNIQKIGVVNKMNKKINSLNTILYGPPGTGKTYNSKYYAVAICDPDCDCDYDKAKAKYPNYDDLIKRYDELVEEKRIAFTTFHQSYGYEEFIEGIKPIVKDDDSNDVYYDTKDGLFKEFCQRADKQIVDSQNPLFDNDALVYKVSILEDNRNQKNIKNDCFSNGRIRMDFSSEPGKAKRLLDKLQKGDIVLSFKTREIIDGIGVVKDDSSYELSKATEFKTTRDVEWLLPNVDINILKYNNNKKLSRPTLHVVRSMTVANVIEMLNDNNKPQPNIDIKENTNNYVFIIDEINRGNISKIFGELITLIEPSKRKGAKEGMTCVLPYSGDDFSVPKNVYILGTMNTADRSIALMDTALRRRFDFIEMMPDYEVDFMQNLKVGNVDIVKMLRAMNDRIEVLYDREHTLGHAFFKGVSTIEELGIVFENKIIPLLQEYFFEDYEKIALVLGDNAKTDKNFKFIITDNINANIFRNGDIPDSIVDKRVSKLNLKEAIKHEESYIQIYE